MAQRSRTGLQQQLVLAFTLILLIPMAAIAAYSHITARATLIERVADTRQHAAAARAGAVERLLAGAAGDLLLFAQAPPLRRYAGSSAPDRAELAAALQGFLRRSPGPYAALCLLDAAGREVVCVRDGIQPGAPAPALTPTLFERALRLEAAAELAVAVAPVDAAAPGGPSISYATPVLDERGVARGVLALAVPAAPIFDLLIDGDPQVTTAILDGAGAFLVRPAGGAGEVAAPSIADEQPADAGLILAQPEGAILASVDRPEELQVFRRVEPPGQSAVRWVVLYAQPLDAIVARTLVSQLVTGAFILAALTIVLLSAHLLARGIVRPLRELSGAAARVGSGDLHAPIPHRGPEEIAALGQTFGQTVARLREAIVLAEGRRHEAETLRAAARAIGSTLSLDEVLSLILSELGKVVPYDSASVQLVHGDTSTVIGSYGLAHSQAFMGLSFTLEPGVTPNAEIARTRAPLLLDDAPASYPLFSTEPFRADPIRSWLGVPLLFGERLIGMITLDKHEPGFYTGEHARLAGDFVAHAAIAIEHARLYEAAHRELAERRRAEAAHARLAAVIETTSDLVSMGDPKGRVLYVNPAGRRLLGLADDLDLSATRVRDYFAPQMQGRLREATAAAIAAGTWAGETVMLGAGGVEIPVSQVVIAHYGADGSPEFFSSIIRDMRERRRAEEELRQAQKMEALGRLAGGLAHDFNNLLTVILGECDMLLDELGPADPSLGSVEQIRQSGVRAAALTRQLLAFSRRQMLQPELLDLNEVVAGMEQLLRRLIGEDITLTIALTDGLPTVRADPGQVEQVVMNLAINARDAMPDGGHLRIETAAAPGGEPAQAYGDGSLGACAVLIVSDTGQGMDEATRAHVFEPFFTTKPRGKGTGLGLATVHGIVRQSGGQIVFASEEGRGSTFTVYLPAAQGEPAPAPAPPRRAAERASAETVLLVEDDEHVRSLARAILLRHGFVVLEAGDGNRAVELARSHAGPIHALLTDVVMPGGLNGVQTAAAVRALRPQIPVLYMSGYTDDVLAGRDLLDDTRYIQKPFAPEALIAALMESLAA